jgi:5-formyltetrahydrofolate cyclo-ligase
MSIPELKENLRAALATTTMSRPDGNKAAEHLRRHETYRQAKVIFVSPASSLLQLRINALADGKELIMPGPGLKEGFYLFKPYSLAFRDLGKAVTLAGLPRYGTRLLYQAFKGVVVDMMVTDAVAVDGTGGRLGDGHGFFDLACAALYELKAVAANNLIAGVVAEAQIVADELPLAPWDVRLDLLVTPEGCREIKKDGRPSPAIYWEVLSEREIRKKTPLWHVFQQRAGEKTRSTVE